MTGSMRRFDQHRGELVLDERLDKASAAFQLALQIAYLDLGGPVENALADALSRLRQGGRGAPL